MRVWKLPALCSWANSCLLPPLGVPDPWGLPSCGREPSLPEHGQQIPQGGIQMVWGHQAVWSDLPISSWLPRFLRAHDGSKEEKEDSTRTEQVSRPGRGVRTASDFWREIDGYSLCSWWVSKEDDYPLQQNAYGFALGCKNDSVKQSPGSPLQL